MNSFSGAVPACRVGALRFWDSGTRWIQLKPRHSEFDWSTLDRILDRAGQSGLPTLFAFGGTPTWATPNARKTAHPNGSRAAPRKTSTTGTGEGPRSGHATPYAPLRFPAPPVHPLDLAFRLRRVTPSGRARWTSLQARSPPRAPAHLPWHLDQCS
ncbi:beta-galactosidase [Streptomyces sp. NPDC096153]|uniref:beta-galactosidase n=1 Tax=Streptomyces sp. NPDC096153 TaxID=3155548 RepID=UPI0033296B28